MSKTYETLKSEFRSPKAIEALDRVNEAIEFYIKQKMMFNISSIGRYCEDNYEELSQFIKDKLKEFKSNNNLSSNSVNKNEKSIDNIFFNQIEDENLKNYIRIQQEKYKNSIKLVEETKILDLIKTLNNNFLSKIDIKLGYKNGVVFNLNTDNIIFELNK